MKVLNIKRRNNKNTNCQVLFESDEGSITEVELSMDILLKENLNKGTFLNNAVLEKILQEQRIINVKQAAYNYASYCMRTRKQIIQKLSLLGFADNEINCAINFLLEFNLIDDKLFAQKYIKDILLKKKVGKNKIINSLLTKGIDKETVAIAIKEYYPEEESNDMAVTIAEKKLRYIKFKSIEKTKASLYNHLISKGFDFEDAKNAVDITTKNFNTELD